MRSVVETLTLGAASFGATNVDDLFVLTLFFSHAAVEGTHRWPIVAGQYLGFAILVAVSLTGCLLQIVLSREGIGLLGLLPVALGIREWFRLRQREFARTEQAVGKAASWAGSAASVAIVTVANGADNLGVYIPLFAASDVAQLYLTLLVFGVLLAAWCHLGHWLGSRPVVAWTVRRRGVHLVPWLFIALGLYIVLEHRSWRLFL